MVRRLAVLAPAQGLAVGHSRPRTVLAAAAVALLAAATASFGSATVAHGQPGQPLPFRSFVPGLVAESTPPVVAQTTAGFYVPDAPRGPATELEQRIFTAVNLQRTAAGVRPYVYDADLSYIARVRSRQMADQGYFGHTDPYGYTMYSELLQLNGFTTFAWAGEDLALNNYGPSESPERAVDLLMKSPSHRDNLLTTDFSRVGIGHVLTSDGRNIYTLIFLG